MKGFEIYLISYILLLNARHSMDLPWTYMNNCQTYTKAYQQPKYYTPVTSALTSDQPPAWFRALRHNFPHVIDDLNSNRISVNYNWVR